MKKQHGGKRKGAGRPRITDKVKPVDIYLRQSTIKAVGGKAAARQIGEQAVKAEHAKLKQAEATALNKKAST